MFLKQFLLLIVIFLCLTSNGCQSDCTNNTINQFNSPNNRFIAVVFTRNCGSSTDYSTQVSILPFSEKLGDVSGNVFICDSNHKNSKSYNIYGGPEVSVNWLNENQMVIKYSRGSRIFLSNIVHGLITIQYQEI